MPGYLMHDNGNLGFHCYFPEAEFRRMIPDQMNGLAQNCDDVAQQHEPKQPTQPGRKINLQYVVLSNSPV